MVDTHAHLTSDFYPVEELDIILSECRSKGIKKIINIGVNLKSCANGEEMARKYPDFLYFSAGIHPTEKVQLNDVEKVIPFTKKAIAIGECGLEYWDDMREEDMDFQKKIFIKQIELAKDLSLPLIIHCRGIEAIDEMIEIVSRYYEKGAHRSGVWHSTAGDPKQAQKLIERGFYISFNGIITFKNAQNTRDLLENTDLKNILIETDCPFLTPDPFRGKRNSPVYIPYIIEKIALLKNTLVSEVERITDENAQNLFLF